MDLRPPGPAATAARGAAGWRFKSFTLGWEEEEEALL